MEPFVVHTIPGSPFARAVLASLVEKGAAYRVATVRPGTLRSEEHLALHPFGRVPVLEHEGFRLYETQAILRYLERTLPVPALIPSDPQRAARMDQIMGIGDWYLFPGVSAVIGFERVIKPLLLGGEADEAALAKAMPRAHVAFETLSRLMGEQNFLAGDALSLADLMIGPQMAFLAMTPEWAALTAGRGNLVEWLARLERRESFVTTTMERVSQAAQAA